MVNILISMEELVYRDTLNFYSRIQHSASHIFLKHSIVFTESHSVLIDFSLIWVISQLLPILLSSTVYHPSLSNKSGQN